MSERIEEEELKWIEDQNEARFKADLARCSEYSTIKRLLAEIRRLTAEVERLKRENLCYSQECTQEERELAAKVLQSPPVDIKVLGITNDPI